jgi:hypothetical protein
VIRRLLMKRLQEVNLSLEDGQALLERLERGVLSADDRHLVAQVVRATHASQTLLDASRPPASTPPQRKAKRKRQAAKASRRRNRR